jgi:hypothetical protein
VSVFGVLLGIVALSALTKMSMTGSSPANLQQAKQVEDRMERARLFIDGKLADPTIPVTSTDDQTSENPTQQESEVAAAGPSGSK